MTRLLASATLVAIALGVLGASAQQPVFRGESDTVRVYATVVDKDGRLVTTLVQKDFEVRDEGKPQPITVFDNSPQPIQLVVMLDVSGSMQGNLQLLRASAQQLFTRLLPDDGARLVKAMGSALASTFAGVTSHAPAPVVQAAVMQARRDGVDAIVSFGGGSCADTGKAINFFAEQEAGTPGASWADRPALPHIAVPTTYSGAELTPFFGMTDPHTRQKQGAGGPTCAPMRLRVGTCP